jgi:hypothetical protein
MSATSELVTHLHERLYILQLALAAAALLSRSSQSPEITSVDLHLHWVSLEFEFSMYGDIECSIANAHLYNRISLLAAGFSNNEHNSPARTCAVTFYRRPSGGAGDKNVSSGRKFPGGLGGAGPIP